MSACLDRQLSLASSASASAPGSSSNSLAPLANLLLNLTLLGHPAAADSGSQQDSGLCFTGSQLVDMADRLARALPNLAAASQRPLRPLPDTDHLSALVLSLSALKLAQLMDLTASSDAAASDEAIVGQALAYVDANAVAMVTKADTVSKESDNEDDADELCDLQLLTLHLTSELLCNFGVASARLRGAFVVPIVQLVGRLESLLGASTSGGSADSVLAGELADFGKSLATAVDL